eukprot:TRINITY_DN11264_c0_g1_i1.p1 TRINITY_DN11264_c0_g1~~TRINITY_DN11264_c0_g1_i1.p1  ORF type:complete len:175 (-),score=31.92 TRINITY_DN11264_c0_g1_i1:32-556(-)
MLKATLGTGIAALLFFVCFVAFMIPAAIYSRVYTQEHDDAQTHVQGSCVVNRIDTDSELCSCGDDCDYICYSGDWIVEVFETAGNDTDICYIAADYTNEDEDDQENNMKGDYNIGREYSCWHDADDLSDCRWDEPDDEYYRGVIIALWIIAGVALFLAIGFGVAFGVIMFVKTR